MDLAMFYPPSGLYFHLTVASISGKNEGSFQEVSGLTVKIGVEEIQECGENRFAHKFPTSTKYENLVLKRGMLVGAPLINWARSAVEQFKFEPKLVVIELLDDKAVTLTKWNIMNAYPVALKISELKAQENAIAIESLELAFDYFVRIL